MLEKRFDVNGYVNDMYVCASCHVIDNFSITPESGLEETSAQRDASVAYYTISDEQLEHIRGELSGTKGILDYFQSYFSDIDHKSFLEIGSGLGLMLLAADQFGFGEVVGVDLNTDSFAELKQYFPPSKDIQMHPDLEHVQVQADYVFMWHTLEHIYDPTAFMQALRPRLRPNTRLFIQVPQYTNAYIFATHYHFYNEPSLTALFARHGYSVLQFGYDCERQYITVVAESTN